MSHQGLTHTLLRKNTCDDFYMGNAFPLKILHYFVSFCDVGQEVWNKLTPRKEPTSEPGEHRFEPSYPGHWLMSIGCFDISLKWQSAKTEREISHIQTAHTVHGFLKYIKAIYCHPAYVTYMQSTSWETLGWKKHKLESRCREKYQSPLICWWHRPYGRKWRRTTEPLDESERGEWKSWLKAQHLEN